MPTSLYSENTAITWVFRGTS